MSVAQVRWYPSKIDWWLVPLLCVPAVAVVAACVASLVAGDEFGVLVGIAAVVFVAAIYIGLVFPMRYGLDDTHLLVRFGLCRRRIRLDKIVDVRPTHNPVSSPALSLDRLLIRYGRGLFNAVIISPDERDRFLNDLAQAAGLRRNGDHLSRA